MGMEQYRAEDILNVSASARPTHPAIIDRHGECSYQDLALAASRVRDALRRVGAPEGAIIGVSLTQAREFLAAVFGILQARCVAIPIAPNISAMERVRLLTETGVAFVVFTIDDERYNAPTTRVDGSSLLIGSILPEKRSRVLELYPDAALIRYTSGTTSLSKGVVVSRQAVVERAETSRELLEVGEDDRVLATLPLSYHFIASALSFVRAGATILDCAMFSPSETLACGVHQRATMMYGSPLQYELISRTPEARSLVTLRRAISTSALVSRHTAELFESVFHRRLTQVYGVIEVGLPLWNVREDYSPTSLGECQAPYESRIVSEDGVCVEPGVVGELWLRGPGCFSGYLLGNEGGERRSRDSWFATGDLVTRHSSGEITYHGRKKSVINCGGNKVFPEEVEEVLVRIPGIVSARVSGESHPLLGSVVVAEVVLESGQQPAVDAWRTRCYRELSGYKVPKEFRVVSSLPLTGSGKVVRESTREEVASA